MVPPELCTSRPGTHRGCCGQSGLETGVSITVLANHGTKSDEKLKCRLTNGNFECELKKHSSEVTDLVSECMNHK